MDSSEAPTQRTVSLTQNKSKKDFLTVGIGASAGGVQALKEFFSKMPPDSGMAFAVVLHLSQTYVSNLAEILGRETKMPVVQVTEAVKVEPNHVYVIPPAKGLEMIDGVVRLTKPQRSRGARVVIDRFFRTLADAYGASAVGIILSGTGEDGALGLKKIKEEKGFAIAQEPSDAEYDEMPRSAVETGLIDWVLPIEKMPEKLLSLRKSTEDLRLTEADEGVIARELTDLSALREIITVLRVRTGHDFSNYKHPTLLRRIARHLQIHELENMQEYVKLLRERPEEVEFLLANLLINVTNFFRNPEAFDVLESDVVPRMFAGKTASDQIRVWVPACATGEEVYSIAMLLCEYASRFDDVPKIQIFASDVDEEAIAFAREGLYGETSCSQDVSPARLRRFFNKEGKGFRVKKSLREMVLFASHNILRDPPFSKLDLISCRNLMIYLNREAQERVMSLFHFALQPNGFLFLGSSESAENLPLLFSPYDKKQRIYLRRPTNPVDHSTLALPLHDRWLQEKTPFENSTDKRGGTYSFNELHFRLLEKYAPPSLLVNEDYEIVHLTENVGRYLQFIGGEPTSNLLKVVHPALRPDLRAALFSARQDDKTSETRAIRLEIAGEKCFVNVRVNPVDAPDAGGGFMLVIFEESKTAENAPLTHSELASINFGGNQAMEVVVHRLEEELTRTKNRLRSTIEQHETSIEELKASNEELMSMNEELRSATEELETSKEELQSVNEELTTVNYELGEKVEELSRANSDLQNLIHSTDIGTIFLDRNLQIKRFTPSAQEIFNLISSDTGRRIDDLTNKLNYENLTEDAIQVLRKLRPIEREVKSHKGQCYLARLLPYRTADDKIDGVVLTFLDITERKQAEQALRESEERFRRAFAIETVGVIYFKPEGEITDANDAFLRMSGYTREDLTSGLVRWDKQTPPEFMPQSLQAVAEFKATGRTTPYEKQYMRKDGSRWWALFAATRINAEEGVEFIIDITARKQAEKSIQFQAHLLDAVEQSVIATDLSGIVLFWNRFAEKLFGWTAEEAIGRNIMELTTPKVLANQAEDIMSQLRQGKSWSGEFSVQRRDGTTFPAQVLNSPITDDNGTLIGVVGISVDISERKHAEQALQESEERLRLIMDGAEDYAIMTLDSEGFYTAWNTGAQNLFGYSEEEALGQHSEIIFTPEDRAKGEHLKELETARQEGRAADERFHIRKDGTRFYVSGVMMRLHGGNERYSFAKIARDLTERQQMEEALRKGDRRKDEFLATLAHELRNPLAPIRTALEIMRRGNDEEKGQQAREIIERQTNQLVHLVDDLLDISRITQDKIKLRKERIEIADSITAAVETVQPFVENMRHRLDVRLPDAPVFVEADRTRLTQIVLNLLHNSAKYTEPGGHILLIAAREGDEAVIRIRDNGIGIQFEMLPAIFDMFAQTVIGEKRGQGGLGIGLSLVKKLVEMHGGRVEAHSEGEGKGSEFIVRLPLAADQKPEKKQEKQETEKPRTPIKAGRILVVDDNTDAANMLEIFLSMENHEVRTAFTGHDAIQAAAEFQPDTVILDIGLPDIDGYEVAKRLRQRSPDICLVALSGWGQDEDRRRSNEAGFNHHLVKPVNIEELKEFLCV
jgi:two-component system CheB/CheR fusion protein